MTTTIPRTTATNAYDLLSEIAALALEEPKRMDMEHWRLLADDDYDSHHAFPACGMVGCIGGWTEALTGYADAATVLGLNAVQEHDLFYHETLVVDANRRAQTPEHADAVVTHIREFQKQHAKQLKAKPIAVNA